MQLLRRKKCAWSAAKNTRDYARFKALSKTATAAIRQHRRCREDTLVYARNRNAFAHVRNCTSSSKDNIELTVNNRVLSHSEAADALLQEFSSNFSHGHSVTVPTSYAVNTSFDLVFNYTPKIVATVLKNCSSTNSSRMGFLFAYSHL